MPVPDALSDREWTLVIELLQREARELPTEIHHTDSAEMRHDLRQRLVMVRDLLSRIREPARA